MEHINRVEIQGLVGNVRVNQAEKSNIYHFSVSTDKAYNNGGATIASRTWHSIEAWEHDKCTKEELAQLGRGMGVHVIGHLSTQMYIDSEGIDRVMTVVIADELTIMES